jgi:hypothetical protein
MIWPLSGDLQLTAPQCGIAIRRKYPFELCPWCRFCARPAAYEGHRPGG